MLTVMADQIPELFLYCRYCIQIVTTVHFFFSPSVLWWNKSDIFPIKMHHALMQWSNHCFSILCSLWHLICWDCVQVRNQPCCDHLFWRLLMFYCSYYYTKNEAVHKWHINYSMMLYIHYSFNLYNVNLSWKQVWKFKQNHKWTIYMFCQKSPHQWVTFLRRNPVTPL